MEYLSGILLEPIARYFIKVCDALKNLLNESTKDVVNAAGEKADGTAELISNEEE